MVLLVAGNNDDRIFLHGGGIDVGGDGDEDDNTDGNGAATGASDTTNPSVLPMDGCVFVSYPYSNYFVMMMMVMCFVLKRKICSKCSLRDRPAAKNLLN